MPQKQNHNDWHPNFFNSNAIMNICVFLRLTQTYNNEPVKVSCIHLEHFKCAVRFVVAGQTIHTKTNKHIFFSCFSLRSCTSFQESKVRKQRKFVWCMLSTWEKRAQHFHSFYVPISAVSFCLVSEFIWPLRLHSDIVMLSTPAFN